MMTNLFSTFDPATSMTTSMNWSSTFLIISILPALFWLMPNRNLMIFKVLMMSLHLEFKMLLKNKSQGLSLMMITLFMFILSNNLMGMLPYIFTSSSHLTFALTMALPLWVSTMMYGWISKPQEMFAHLVPVGTPAILMPFMVIIETISNIIRPGSLAVRLTANMIAGHLLMSLLGSNMEKESLAMPMIFSVQIMLMMFEIAVAMIQAYVFSVLMTLYSSEVL